METGAEADARTILVIYTGGTIGMLLGDRGYQPEPFYLTTALKHQTRFNDPIGNSLYSNSASIAEWRMHKRDSNPETPSGAKGSPLNPLITVRSTRPVCYPDHPYASTETIPGVFETPLPSLVTPASSTDKRIRYVILEWQPILDSSDMGHHDWIRLATEVELNYAYFDAFLILSGTDTICYTSSALSFLLEDLGKTVIITGAQIPLSQLRNDAVDNLLGSLSIAECCLYFNHILFRGNRVSKTSSSDLDAFSSPNFPTLVDVGTNIEVNWRNVLVPRALSRCPATLRLFPGITAASARSFLAPPIRGVILESFGAGNAPQRQDLLDAIKEACDYGVVIVTISQCTRGSVSSAYAAGRSLYDSGVVAGADMTPEAALSKLSYLLSKRELSTDDVRRLMSVPLRGELSLPASPNDIRRPEGSQGVMSHIYRLSIPSTLSRGSVFLSTGPPLSGAKGVDTVAGESQSLSDVSISEILVMPYLIHLAASKNDAEAVRYCLDAFEVAVQNANQPTSEAVPNAHSFMVAVGGGIVNALDPCGRAPLHTAALHGSQECTEILLRGGASVHLRDSLDHTPLYYAKRQHADGVVLLLESAGAFLAGSDLTHREN
ncbi:asparaginase-domain-containing protein [Cantharellus anzutake]|uniref:asparaginase-domain-containing protein n=1 Tax=Cantharellus anzutake TaxID=1750568 RepID=UPI0019046423|nr:asparaginase-domain-containing protein [Cantharellus anzutake]KAF8334233.1 asparaginase-domain-containing protein [Cantharellus anzutake]